MRKLIIAGNWKMNAGPTEAEKLAVAIAGEREGKEATNEILVCPPSISIPAVVQALRNTQVQVGAQNVYTEDNGAYTGEISTSMIKDAGCSYVIVGHSERREYFNEDDEFVAKKAKKALADGLNVIVCVGEKLDERKSNRHEVVVKSQVGEVLNHLDPSDAERFVIAYEPVWAIGTGETATPQQAQDMHKHIRSLVAAGWSEEAANSVRILYGGSMKPGNAEELLSQPDVDGGLIGGASLKADSFGEIIDIAESI